MENSMKIRTYSELLTLPTFEERFRYLRLDGAVGKETFGFDRYLNQRFYTSKEWKRVRDTVIIRDGGFDLGVDEYPLGNQIMIHHMNPITAKDILDATEFLMNPEYLISTCRLTHNAIHYGTEPPNRNPPVERHMYDTCPWRK